MDTTTVQTAYLILCDVNSTQCVNSSQTIDTNTTSNGTFTRNERLAQIEIAVQSVIFTLAVLGNSTVLLSLYFRGRHLSRMHVLMVHLSIADLFVAFGNVLPQLIWDVTFVFYGGDFLCKLVKYMQIVAMYASSYVLVMTAIDRYVALCHPFVSHKWSTGKVHKLVSIAWALSLIFSLPQLVIFSYKVNSYGMEDCWGTFEPEWTLTFYITSCTVLVYIIPTIILIFCYGSICVVVWRAGSIGERLTRLSKRFRPTSQTASMANEALTAGDSTRAGNRYPVCVFRKQNKEDKSDVHVKVNSVHDAMNNPDVVQDVPNTLDKLSNSQNEDCDTKPVKYMRLINCFKTKSTISKSKQKKRANQLKALRSGSLSDLNLINQNETMHISPGSENRDNNSYRLKPSNTPAYKQVRTPPRRYSETPQLSQKVQSSPSQSYRSTYGRRKSEQQHGISRAKIRTVKLTLAVVLCYLICWSPFFIAQMWAVYDQSAPFYGAAYTIILLLASLNSCTNPWIYLVFSDSACSRLKHCMSRFQEGSA